MQTHKILLATVRVLLLSLLWMSHATAATSENIAFFYGSNPAVNAWSQYDRIVLESENISADELSGLKQHGAATFAYLSVGEVGPDRKWNLKPEWSIGFNGAWKSKVMDLTNSGWQRFLLQRVDQLVAAGYDGLFLDTMDSHLLAVTDTAGKAAQQNALANLLYRIKKRHPSIRMISNRGFEVMDKIATYIEAVAAESLYAGWDNATREYKPVPADHRQWLAQQLSAIKQSYDLDTIIIDYVPTEDRDTAREVANKITADGFIPWVTNPGLDYLGIGSIEIIPREVIMIYDSTVNGLIEEAEVHTLIAMPLEYMGYVPVYHDIATMGLPKGILKGSYAGIVAWYRDQPSIPEFSQWLNKQIDDQLPLAMFGSIGTDLSPDIGSKLGLTPGGTADPFSLKPIIKTDMVGFEAQAPDRIDQYSMSVVNVSDSNTSHLRYRDKYDEEIDMVITGPWGGLALFPTIQSSGPDRVKDWVIDPFNFLKTALQLENVPMPDITSENGTRLWLAHIDGDAMPSWAELPGRNLGSEIIRDKIIKRYKLPHTISVVEAEMYTIDRRERMEKTARDLFALDYVEIATHTYSHPFNWQELKHGDESTGENNLRIPGYKFSLEREIAGSARYIDETLAPPGKKTEILLWSGDAVPPAEAIEIAERVGLINMNGGNTTISSLNPTMAAISANARIVGGKLQVFAPIMNENVYTNEWLGPYDGFRRVIETYEMTGFPRRIKPINVYYHFYAGTKKASLRSLEEIYDWSMQQDILPVLSSEYIVKVPHFRTAGVARHLDGSFTVSGLGPIKSLRTIGSNIWPDLDSSANLAGAKQTHDAIYIHTDGSDRVTFSTQANRPQTPHLVSANAKLEKWQKDFDGRINLRLSGSLPVVFEMHGDQTFCAIKSGNQSVRGKLTENGNTRFELTTKDTGNATIDCET